MSNWLSLLCGVLFVYRGIQDLRNGGGTGWSSEDEKKHFSKFSGIALLLCGAVYLCKCISAPGRTAAHHFNGHRAAGLHRLFDLQSVLSWHTE